MPSARSTMRATTSSATPLSACLTSCSAARRDSGASWIVCRWRAIHRSGKRSSTSGRASASTMNGWSCRLRSALSRKLTVPRSPQCRSSSTSSTGCAAHSAISQSSNARRMPSPISCGLARAARSASRCVSSKRTSAISPRNSVTRSRISRGTCRPIRAASFSRRASSGSPSRTPAARRIMRASIANGDPAPTESPPPKKTSARSGWRWTQSISSCRSRDLPTPAVPTTSTAVAVDSAAVPA